MPDAPRATIDPEMTSTRDLDFDESRRSRVPVLVDALSERLAFERMGVRLYDEVLERCRAAPATLSSEELARLHDFRADECLHAELLRDAMRALLEDPSRQTPGAVRVTRIAAGVLAVLADPGTPVRQALQGLLDVELVDNAGWDLLIELARAGGRLDLVDGFTQALVQENRHLHAVRDIVARLALQDTMAEGTAPGP